MATTPRFRQLIAFVASGAVLLAIASSCATATSPLTASPAVTATTATAPPTTTPPAPKDAAAVLEALKAAGLPITNASVQDENTDPNHLIGRPGEYTSRASFDVPGGNTDADPYDIDRGGVIEVFATKDDATRRAGYIDGIHKAMPITGTEYLYQAGAILVRISGLVKPSVAKPFETAVAALAT